MSDDSHHAFSPTPSQASALAAFTRFLAEPTARIFVLTGPAGTGKTTLLQAFARLVDEAKLTSTFLAPTARAAKVIEGRIGRPASTIHSALYAFTGYRYDLGRSDVPVSVFGLREPSSTAAVVFFDEASMISARAYAVGESEVDFGGRGLLVDIVATYRAENPTGPKLVFVGDPFQLPPIHEVVSAALDPAQLSTAAQVPRAAITHVALTEVVRQANLSGVLRLATSLRRRMEAPQQSGHALDDLHAFSPDVEVGTVAAVHADIAQRHDTKAAASATFVRFTNQNVDASNRIIRQLRFGEDVDRLHLHEMLVARRTSFPYFVDNGDFLALVELLDVEHVPIRVRGRTVVLRYRAARVLQNGSDVPTTVTLLENHLLNPAGDSFSQLRQAQMVHFKERHPSLRPGTHAFGDALSNDGYWHAIQAAFSYALTCHKAQGSEWSHVATPSALLRSHDVSDQRWIYTAITRSRDTLTLAAPSQFSPI